MIKILEDNIIYQKFDETASLQMLPLKEIFLKFNVYHQKYLPIVSDVLRKENWNFLFYII